MHESTLARQMLDIILHYAAMGGASRIRAVRGWVADTEAVSNESLRLHFANHARGTEAEGARLELEVRHMEVRCTGCSQVYAARASKGQCPQCGSAAAEQLSQQGIGLTAIEVD